MPTTTLGNLDAATLSRVDGNTAFYPSGERYGYLNEACRLTNAFVGFYQGYVDVPGDSVAGQVFYAIPDGIFVPLAVWLDKKELQKSSLSSISESNRTWLRDTTDSTGSPVSEWIPLGLNMFALHPADSDGGGKLRVFGIKETPLLVNSSDVISVEDEFAELMSEYAGHVLPLKEGGKPFADASRIYTDSYQKKLRERMRWTTVKMPKYTLEREQR